MTRKKIVVLILGLILFACLLVCGYFGAKTLRWTYQRRAAIAAYEKKDYEKAERLLLHYVSKDPNSEASFVALANIYREFGDIGTEAQMWQRASSLNPLNEEYRKNMIDAAAKSASYGLLYSNLGRKAKAREKMDDMELYLYMIAAFRIGQAKEGKAIYKEVTEKDPAAFQKSDLGRLAEFMAVFDTLQTAKQQTDLRQFAESEDPVVRFEALYSTMLQTVYRTTGEDESEKEEIEGQLKQLKEINYYAGTPILANYLFSQYRFDEVRSEAEPYLKKIDNFNLYVLYAESCAISDKLDQLKALKEKMCKKTGILSSIADYCDVLIAFMENDEKKLMEATRKTAKVFSTPIFRFIRLRVAMTGTYNEILAAAKEVFQDVPFYDLQERASILCLDYLSSQMMLPENQDTPSKMAELAKIISGYQKDNKLVSVLLLLDQYRKGLVKEADLLAALDKFPDDPLLLRTVAEYMIVNDRPGQALPLFDRITARISKDDVQPSTGIQFLKMMALDQTGQHDEAAQMFKDLVARTDFNPGLLSEFFDFCIAYKRIEDLNAMADKLNAVQDGKLKPYSAFFRAAALILTEDEAKKNEALKILAATPEDDPIFTFYAANELSDADRFDEAEKKYKAVLDTYPIPFLVYVNLSEVYKSKGDAEKALEAAKKGFELGQSSWLSSFIYARRLSDAGRYQEAVEILNLPRRAEKLRVEVVELWTTCMKKVIEKSIADQRYMQAEEQCKHLLIYAPDDAFAKENLETVRKKLSEEKDKGRSAN